MNQTLPPLTQILRDRILAEGTLSVTEYMDAALNHPEHGYYRSQRVFGAEGDFVTSPEISQIFGELLGVWAVDIWQQLGCGAMALVELGPGRGTLMDDALRATRRVAGFHDAISVHMVETSPTLAHEQYQRLRHVHPRIEWLDHIRQLPDNLPLVVLANEFFDALPIRQHVKTADGVCERRVGWNEDDKQFFFTLGKPGLQLAKSSTVIAEGTVIESCPLARELLRMLAERIQRNKGAALIIDYGYLGDAHHDTLQAVHAHQFHPVLKNPGSADITAHVDFATLLREATSAGLATQPLISQGQFLALMGAEERLKHLLARATPEQKQPLISGITRLISPQAMGELFKVMMMHSPVLTPSGVS